VTKVLNYFTVIYQWYTWRSITKLSHSSARRRQTQFRYDSVLQVWSCDIWQMWAKSIAS